MKAFFFCFSCGDKQQAVTPLTMVQVKNSEANDKNELNNISSMRDYQDNKSNSATTLTFRTTADTFPSNMEDQDSYIRKKIEQIRKKDFPQRKAMESEFVKQNLSKSIVIYLVEKQWSEQYTSFLKNIDQKEIRPINNQKLVYENGSLKADIREKENYFIINERVWKFVQQMYGGGPTISRDIYFPVFLIGHKKIEVPVLGMVNHKFTCYMISVLQCLFSIQQLNYYFFKKVYADNSQSQDAKKKPLHNLMHKLIKDITEVDDVKVDLKQFSQFFQSKFSLYEQHDAHQFFLHLLNIIQEQSRSQPQVKKQFKDPEDAYSTYFKHNRSIMDKIFAGQIQTSVTCARCDTFSLTFIPFLDLQLELVDNTLEGCLRKHFSQEKLDDLYDCQKCGKKTNATKQYSITKTPNYLAIVLKKFQQNGKKIEERVKYPVEIDLKKQKSSSIHRICKGHYGESRYILQSVLVHKGIKSTKGHYYCYTRRIKKSWHYLNDQLFKEIQQCDSIGRDAYMLFYERVK